MLRRPRSFLLQIQGFLLAAFAAAATLLPQLRFAGCLTRRGWPCDSVEPLVLKENAIKHYYFIAVWPLSVKHLERGWDKCPRCLQKGFGSSPPTARLRPLEVTVSRCSRLGGRGEKKGTRTPTAGCSKVYASACRSPVRAFLSLFSHSGAFFFSTQLERFLLPAAAAISCVLPAGYFYKQQIRF